METINRNWDTLFKEECVKAKFVRIISPFIGIDNVKSLLKIKSSKSVQLITRFNLNDFSCKASDINAIKLLLKNGVEIRGIKDLHSKIYLFDRSSVIIGSANFTLGGFKKNYEFGIISKVENIINDSNEYFKKLWDQGNKKLSLEMLNDWEQKLNNFESDNNYPILEDFGNSLDIVNSKYKNVFVKFYGASKFRKSSAIQVNKIIKVTHCHYAATFPKFKNDSRPKRYNDGDVIYMAQMTDDGYRIFGKAVAKKHNRKRDIANVSDVEALKKDILSEPEIENGDPNWRVHYCIYIRIYSSEFINTKLCNTPNLNNLIDELGPNSFMSTYKNKKSGVGNTNPKKSIMQKADIALSPIGAEWLEEKFNTALQEYGVISDEYINTLYQG